MRPLTPEGRRTINHLAQRYGFSSEAVMTMLQSVIEGHGTMAQFNHPEFGGVGQWMQGGMIMLSDMFNHVLKAKVDGLCNELSNLLLHQPDMVRPSSSQSQHQGCQPAGNMGGEQSPSNAGPSGTTSLFVPPSEGRTGAWWPGELGSPTAVGAQNNVQYAYFRGPRRLAIAINGQVTVYDTLDHQIGGFSQQQSLGGSLTFNSQHGVVNIADLPVISPTGRSQRQEGQVALAQQPQERAQETEIFAVIERLAELKARGLLSEEEYTAKKADLLSRL
jgi:Short C-terminal domain